MKDFLWTVLLSVIIGIVTVVFIFFVDSQQCKNKFSSFENKWGVFSQCQIKVDGKWIPSESYYIKEDFKK